MDSVSLLVTTTDHATDKTQVKSLTNINPNADISKLKQWVQMGVNLSKDSYVSTTRIAETSCDNDSRVERTFTHIAYTSNGNNPYTKDGNDLTINFKPSQISRSGSTYSYWVYFLSYDITNQNWCIPVITNNTLPATKFTGEFPSSNLGRVGIALISADAPQPGDVVSFTVTVPGDDTYLDSTFNVTINIIEEE